MERRASVNDAWPATSRIGRSASPFAVLGASRLSEETADERTSEARPAEGSRDSREREPTPMMLTQIRKPSTSFAMPFKHRAIGGKILISNTEGSFLLLSEAEFVQFAEGTIAKGSQLYTKLAERDFVRAEIDHSRVAARIRAPKRFLDYGPTLHIVVVTLRCNETCVYCHASRANMDAVHTDMTREIAEQTVRQILCTTSPDVAIEFQGGEPLVAFPIVQHIVE